MKNTLAAIFLTLLLTSPPYLPNAFAQDYTQLSLPEGAKVRLGKGSITGNIAYSPDGTLLALASSIGVWIYDAQTGEELDLLTGYPDWVESVSFSPDGQMLASGSSGGTVRLWDVRSREHLRTLTGHTDEVLSVVFSPDGQTLASGSYGGIRLWDVITGAHKQTLRQEIVTALAFSPDGMTLASGDGEGFHIGGVDRMVEDTIRLWDVATGMPRYTLTGHTDDVESVAFSSDGQTLASGSLDRHRPLVGHQHG